MYSKTTPHTGLEYFSNDVTLTKKNKFVEALFPILMIAVGLTGILLFFNS